jgi:phosphatidylglycerol:prolipoprotein diacylglycerol transferase
MMVCCFIGAWRLLSLSLERAGENPEIAEKMVVTAAVAGIVGSRLNYILSSWGDFKADPMGMLFSGAGFVFYGGFLLAMLAVVVMLWRQKRPVLFYADLAAPALALGYAIGRIGCHLSGDGDYGKATQSFLAFSYKLGVAPTPAGVFVHPTPIYESLISFGFAFLLIRLSAQKALQRPGQLFAVYLMLAASARFFIEFLRVEPLRSLGLTEAQITSLGIFPLAFLLVVFAPRRRSAE